LEHKSSMIFHPPNHLDNYNNDNDFNHFR